MKKGADGKRHKDTQTKVEMVRNCDERDNFIKQFGIEKFDKECQPGKTFEKYSDIPIPEQYNYIWEHFLTIWANSEFDFNGRKVISFGTVRDYEQCFGYSFTIKEKTLLFKIKNWAMEIVSELNKD